MAMCPKCFQNEKPVLAQHCPLCTHRTSIGDQIGFSISTTILTILMLVGFFWLLGIILG